MNPQTEFQDLLRQHKFKLVRQTKHYIYNDPEGRVLTVPSTPSDWRMWRNMIANLKEVVRNPVPSSAIVEYERQRKIVEAQIALSAQQKKKPGSYHGSAKGRGTGFVYIDRPVEFVPDEVREAAREAAKNNKAWDGLIRHIRKQVNEYEQRFVSTYTFAVGCVLHDSARRVIAKELRKPVEDRKTWTSIDWTAVLARQRKRIEQSEGWIQSLYGKFLSMFLPPKNIGKELFEILVSDPEKFKTTFQFKNLHEDDAKSLGMSEEAQEKFALAVHDHALWLTMRIFAEQDFRKPSWMPDCRWITGLEEPKEASSAAVRTYFGLHRWHRMEFNNMTLMAHEVLAGASKLAAKRKRKKIIVSAASAAD